MGNVGGAAEVVSGYFASDCMYFYSIFFGDFPTNIYRFNPEVHPRSSVIKLKLNLL